jgi:hypothetical protein
MRRVLIVMGLFFISFYCFSQQNLPSRIIGRIPNIESTQTYQIQVGAFRITQNANNVFLRLKSKGFNPIYESHFDLTRVLIPNISAGQVWNHLVGIKSLGFDEVIIREDGNYTLRAPERAGLTEDIQNLISLETLEAIKDLGIEINEGRDPPNIEGTYLVSTMQLVRNTAGMNIADQWNKYVTFSGQDNATLTVDADYTMEVEHEHGPMNSKGPGSFIVGEGNKFTVVVDGTREEGGHTAKTVEIFSGELSEAGIINYHWAVMMIDDRGDPFGIWIPNSTGYVKRDSDYFSERVDSNRD